MVRIVIEDRQNKLRAAQHLEESLRWTVEREKYLKAKVAQLRADEQYCLDAAATRLNAAARGFFGRRRAKERKIM